MEKPINQTIEQTVGVEQSSEPADRTEKTSVTKNSENTAPFA